jgi:hypothetical protein
MGKILDAIRKRAEEKYPDPKPDVSRETMLERFNRSIYGSGLVAVLLDQEDLACLQGWYDHGADDKPRLRAILERARDFPP